jgi:DNA-binding NarL/FixJ family response regulator
MSEEKTNIMIIDDHPIIHDGLKTLLASEEDLVIGMNAASASEAVDMLEHEMPDIVTIDLSLGDSDGTYLIQRLRKLYPKLKLLVYTMSEENLFAERTASAGANGYVMKTSSPTELKTAIRTVLAGDLYFRDEIITRLKKKKEGRGIGPMSLIDTLSNREMDIFKLVGEGLDTQAIHERLGISRNTVDTHRINIKNKLELQNGKALDRLAYEVIQQGKVLEKE